MTVTTRFAPSPTGFLHIGGARTALFNWLFAKHHNGRFLLRIEDTDRERSTQAAIDAILDGMNWLGITPDEPPVFQSKRVDRHTKVVEEMLAAGKAYKCYVTMEELAERREKGQALLADIRNDAFKGADLEQAKAQVNELLAPFRSPYRDGRSAPSEDAPYTVRLRAPEAGLISFQDEVQGEVKIKAQEIDDLVLLRADGTPTYMLAVVVDDHDMEITEVIRGDDHLTNTFRQLPIYYAMGWEPPSFAHIPLIHGPDGKKLSKRHGALGVEGYRDLGYIPEGLKNYLLRLGWAHGDSEFITEQQAINWFDLEGINKGPARMDFDKLGYINAEHMKATNPSELLQRIKEFPQNGINIRDETENRLLTALPELCERGQTIPEILKAAEFLLVERPIQISGKAKKKLKGEALDRLKELTARLDELNDWKADKLSEVISQYCEENELSMGQVGPPLRTALTGGLPSPDLNLVLFWLGKDETIGRIDDVLSLPANNAD